ncbi:MAG: response regulator, partial [bacterium]|nr:response regulator [bacterium]
MSKKTIVLADNSYTIRRIVELSFSEEEDIELISFENSLNLREKLLELKPAIVLVDIKLPEFNGYEVCRFVNGTEGLQQTQVFLLKGGFEPVDETLLKGLRFVDIITKPFDSNALVSTIKNLLQGMPAGAPPPPAEEAPASFPEDLPEVGGAAGTAGDEINFSDIKQEIDADDIMIGEPDQGTGPTVGFGAYPDEDVLPSEEITQAHGAQGDKYDLSPATSTEDLDNPFKEEIPAPPGGPGGLTEEEMNIKRNIELQERELEIGSLTQEELDIKKQIGDREKELFQQPGSPPADDLFSFGSPQKEEIPPVEPQPPVQDVPSPP